MSKILKSVPVKLASAGGLALLASCGPTKVASAPPPPPVVVIGYPQPDPIPMRPLPPRSAAIDMALPLVGPDGVSRAFLPGAESLALTGPDELWVVSESGSRLFQRKGRPMTPALARFDTSGLAQWGAPDCSV